MASLRPQQSFPHFSNLPVEIRLRIWQLAAPRRPRVIQIGYDPETISWKAWKDGLGGLPSIVHVSREARHEALKSYTRIFSAYVDPDEDTVFISDPIFSIREPRDRFLRSECANKLRNVALTSEICDGLWESWEQFPSFCEGPARILRMLEGMTHFTLVLLEDGAGFDYSDDEDDQDGGTDEAEDVEGNGEEDTNQPDTTQNQKDARQEPDDEGESMESLEENSDVLRFLIRSDEEAMETMSRGYFRHLGNIHFESAMEHPDHWEAWEFYRNRVNLLLSREQEEFPDWVRPRVSVMAVAYGLRRPGDFAKKIHLLDDRMENHGDFVFETRAAEETEDDRESESDSSW